MRSNSRFSKESTILKTNIETATVNAAIEGQSGVQQTLGYRGILIESAFTPLEFQGVTTPHNVTALFAEVVAILAGLDGDFVSKKLVTQPIGGMVSAMAILAGGDMADAAEVFKQ